MTGIRFTYFAKPRPDGRFKVNLFIKCMDPTDEETVYCERKSAADAEKFVRDVVDDNCGGDNEGADRMLLSGDPTPDMFPVFMFVIGVTWNKPMKCAHYTRVCYERYEMDGKWNAVAALGMEQYEYTFGVLRKLEKKIFARNATVSQFLSP